ncbi:hypothetical protein J010_00360 [Cryptococcus neoformans]|nr:hypothetical protein C355_00376 [Cryptococcus neoformans var. grubii Th84]OXH19459.1 hypothetical protein J010_00360 [Cryptococcus neoformans var. grubii]OXH38906.1 hypothetical protein J009_00381 [Cryptococcus neoformans var. grubii]OXH59740.1 hypothetical protein J003_00382 [Cryptococcus neoformans var. grubii]OXH60396.1 hypothetical protein J004_00408 [Cryptococcus neoformans var. grubii]
MSTSPHKSGTVSPASEGMEAYVLLTIDHANVKQVFEGEEMDLAKGQLSVQCVSLPIPPEIGHQTANPFARSPSDPPIPTQDFWLVLHVGATFELVATPGQMFKPYAQGDQITYEMTSKDIPGASLLFSTPYPKSGSDLEILKSLELLLHQYGCLAPEATALSGISTAQNTDQPSLTAPDELRGKLVLVNEDNGEIIGQMDQQLELQEDSKIAQESKLNPVILDFGQFREGQEALRVKVKTIPEKDLDDWLLRGANSLSRGILSFGEWTSRQMLSGVDLYIKNTTPRAEPVRFGSQTKEGFLKVHSASVKTATVTKSTLNRLQGVIQSAVEKTYTHGFQPAKGAYERYSNRNTPPLPPQRSQSSIDKPNIPPSPPMGNSKATDLTSSLPPDAPGALSEGKAIAYPSQSQSLIAEKETLNPPSYETSQEKEAQQQSANTAAAGDQPKKKQGLLSRVVLASEVVLTSLEATAHDVINSGTVAASSAAGHKFGKDAGELTALIGGSVKNVAVVYIDVAGTGRKAILKSTAKGIIKTRLQSGQTVELQAEGQGNGMKAGEAGNKNGEIVVGMAELDTQTSGTSTLSKK